MRKAECRKPGVDPEWFFPGRGKSTDAAKAEFICFVCPVKAECRKYQKATGSEYGIWAGENAQQGEDSEDDL